MTDYTKTTNFGVKDGLTTGDSNKLVRGSEFDTEFDAIQTAVGTKADKASPTFTGTVTTANITVNGTFKLADTSDDHYYTWAVNELTADRTVTWPLLTGNDTLVFEAHTATLTNKTIDLTSNTLQGSKTEFNTALEADSFLMASDLLDEDTMTSNSATKPASQQSIKAYVDAQIAAPGYVDTTGVVNAGEFARFSDSNTLEALTAAETRTALSLVAGTNIQAYDAGLASIAGLTTAANKMIYTTASDTYAVTDLSAFARTILDDTSQAAAAATILSGAALTSATVAATDKVLVQDADASDALKTVTAQSIANLAPTGALIYLAKADISSATAAVAFTSSTSGVLDDTYEEYIVAYQNVVPVTDGAILKIESSNTGGSPYDSGASDYKRATTAEAYARVCQSVGSDTNETGISGVTHIYNAGNAGYTSFASRIFTTSSAGSVTTEDTHSVRQEAAVVTAIEIAFTSGDIESGTIAIYGVKRA